MRIQNYTANVFSNPSYKEPCFTAKNYDKVSLVARKLELQKDIFEKKQPAVRDIYNNSIEFLKGNINKDIYISKLEETLNKIYNSRVYKSNSSQNIKLSKKEETFFENMFITFDTLEDKTSLTKEQLVKRIALLTK